MFCWVSHELGPLNPPKGDFDYVLLITTNFCTWDFDSLISKIHVLIFTFLFLILYLKNQILSHSRENDEFISEMPLLHFTLDILHFTFSEPRIHEFFTAEKESLQRFRRDSRYCSLLPSHTEISPFGGFRGLGVGGVVCPFMTEWWIHIRNATSLFIISYSLFCV